MIDTMQKCMTTAQDVQAQHWASCHVALQTASCSADPLRPAYLTHCQNCKAYAHCSSRLSPTWDDTQRAACLKYCLCGLLGIPVQLGLVAPEGLLQQGNFCASL